MKQKIFDALRALWIATSDLYFVLFSIWYTLSALTHGRFAWVNLMNMFAFQVFLLLIPGMLAGIFYRLKRLQVASIVAIILFLFMFGGFFAPKGQTVFAASNSLKVMTYNMLAFSPDPSAVVRVIREENADIVFMQETNPEVASLLKNEAGDIYPYQIHYPSDVPLGTSVISRYPFTQMDKELETIWVGKPILLEVNWNGNKITVVNFHMVPTPLPTIVTPKVFNKISEVRKQEAGALLDFLAEAKTPVILGGDMNDVFLNDTYITLRNSGLRDAWTEAGFGLGHTFPGNKSPGTSRVHIGNLYIPEWLVRIDYIFVTPEWHVLSARIAPTDGYSDHRPVTAVLQLENAP